MNCVLCRCNISNLLDFGPIYWLDNRKLFVHQNCLYLSSGLVQRGDEGRGILQFLVPDIMKESKRSEALVCCFCRGLGANIGCCATKCYRTFHTGCGLKNNTQSQFCETFKSYCNNHVRTHKYRPKTNEECVICLERLIGKGEIFNFVTIICSPCCQNGWYHKRCLQSYANSSGYFFKCPLCNNSTTFRDVSCWGISIPDSDAAWELAPNAFRELAQRDLNCTAAQCLNPKGRKARCKSELCYCLSCGSNPVHLNCKSQGDYNCKVCIVGLHSLDIPLDYFFPSQSSLNGNTTNEKLGMRNGNGDHEHQKLQAPNFDDSKMEDDEDDDAIFELLHAYGKEVAMKNKTTKNPEQLPKLTSSTPLRSSNLQNLIPENGNSNVTSTRLAISTSSGTLSSKNRQSLLPENRSNHATSTRSDSLSTGLLSSNNRQNLLPDNDSSDTILKRLRPRASMNNHIASVRNRSSPNTKKADAKVTLIEADVRRTRNRGHAGMPPTASPLHSPNNKSEKPVKSKLIIAHTHPKLPSIKQPSPSTNLTKVPSLDISCVANRTRHRLPVYLANHK